MRQHQNGSALVYILIAIALMGALTVSFMSSDSQQSRSQNSFKLASQIASQMQQIRASIEGCVLQYPGGDNTVSTGTDPGYNAPYPVNPDSDHFNGTSLDGVTNRQVANIACPGNPGDDPEHTLLFGGSSGRNLPPAPGVLDEWTYFNGLKTVSAQNYEGVYIDIRSNNSDPFIVEAFDKVDTQFADCEVDSVDDSDPDCASGYVCLRYWLIKEDGPAC